jgi:hypothetical protein
MEAVAALTFRTGASVNLDTGQAVLAACLGLAVVQREAGV